MCYNLVMKIRIICVGKIKDKFNKDAIAEYQKRLKSYVNLEIIEVQDEKTSSDNEASNNLVKKIEGERISSKIKDGSYNIALCIEGESMTSEKFSKKIDNIMMKNSTINFIIGGSVGIDKNIIDKCDMKLSFSKFTFPHQLMRIILLEQIYRAYKIIKNEPYHK